MIPKPSAGDGANALLVVVLSGVLSNPVPRQLPAGAGEGLTASASGPGVDA